MIKSLILLLVSSQMNNQITFNIGPSGGDVTGQYYYKPNEEVTVFKSPENEWFTIDIDTLQLGTSLKTYIQDIENDLTNKIKELTTTENESKESFIVSSQGHLIRITKKLKYEDAVKKCLELNSTIHETKDTNTLKELKDFQEVLKTSATQTTFDTIWQQLEQNRMKQPRFEKSRTHLPSKIGESATTITLSALSAKENCGTYTLSTSTFTTKSCTEELPAICVSNTNLEDLFQLDITKLHAKSLEKQLETNTNLVNNLLKHTPTITTSPTTTTAIKLIDLEQTNLLTTLKTISITNLSSTTRYNILTFISNFVKLLLRTTDSLTNKDPRKLVNSNSLLDSSITPNAIPIGMFLFKTSDKLFIKIKIIKNSNEMTQINLLPLTVNAFTPTFSGPVLLSKDNKTCIINNCIKPYCTLEHSNISPCCHVHLLQDTSKGDCQITALQRQPSFFNINENTFIVSSHSRSSLKSTNCPLQYVLPQGTVKIKMLNDTSDCKWKVENQLLPTGGKPIVELLTDKLHFNEYDLTKIRISQTFDDLVLPISSFIGTIITIVVSALTIYLYIKNKSPDMFTEEDTTNNEDIESYPLQQTNQVRSILRPTNQMFPTSSGSNSISSTSS